MKGKVRFLGLDVHAETIAVAVAEPDGEVRSLGAIPNRVESIRKLVKKLGPVEQVRACYEAGPTGYVLYWQLAELGIACEVIAPTLIPIKAGDRVKTDRRDAERLARSHRAGDLTAVRVPDEASEALRDLVRAREAAKQDQLRARHRLGKFLLRHGLRPRARGEGLDAGAPGLGAPDPSRAAGAAVHAAGLSARGGAHGRAGEAAGASDRGGGQAGRTRVTRRYPRLTSIARRGAYLGGNHRGRVRRDIPFRQRAATDELQRRGAQRGLQRPANPARSHHQDGQRASATHRDRSRVELPAAAGVGPALRKRQQGVPEEIKEIAWKAQHWLHKRYLRLAASGKDPRKIVTAVGRELLGFIWAIGTRAEASASPPMAA